MTYTGMSDALEPCPDCGSMKHKSCCGFRRDEDDEEWCPHGISYDEPCEECDEEDYEFDLDTAPPSKAYPHIDISEEELPF